MSDPTNYKHTYKFYLYNSDENDYVEMTNPQFWKFTNNGKRIRYTDNDINNPLIQPYNKEGTELIIKKYNKEPDSFIVRSVTSSINNNSNENAIQINELINNAIGRETEEMSRLRKKYRVSNLTSSPIGNKEQVTKDLLFLYNYYMYILEFYKNKISERKGSNALKRAFENKLSYVDAFKNDNVALKEFLDFFGEDLKTYSTIADKYPILDLQNKEIFTNPFTLYEKLKELQNDLNTYHSILATQVKQSKNFIAKINERLKSLKRKRNNNNNNNNWAHDVHLIGRCIYWHSA